MTARLSLALDLRPFERVPAEIAIAGYFANERPPSGPAGRADWRLCGLVSDLLEERRLREKLGAALLVPSFGRLAADRVLLLGLGRRSSLTSAKISSATAGAVRRGLGLGARRLALAPPIGDQAVAACAPTLLRGALGAVIESGLEVELSLVISPEEAPALRRALEEALEARPAPELVLVPASGRPRSALEGGRFATALDSAPRPPGRSGRPAPP